MKNINILKNRLFFGALFLSLFSFSQGVINKTCGFDGIHKEKLLNDAQYRQKTEDFETYLLKNKSKLKTASTDYKVPVVVHVMSDGTSLTSITDEEIQDAIYSLNERYRKIPGTLGDGNGVDVTLEFSLAVRDPNGNCTNGIVRYDLSGNATYVNDGVMRNTSGISDATLKAYSYWNSTQYYNIWLVSQIDGNNGGAGTQGYAYFASAHGSTFDGTLMLASKFKLRDNTTTTHEIGHAFNLYHTFEGDNSGNSCPVNNNCSSDGDRVCDTPPHIRSSSDCVSGINSCDGGSSNDLYIHNYMDYSSDACQSEFTSGQSVRVIAAMTGPRASFLESNGNLSLVPVASPSVEFTASSNFVCTNTSITFVDRSTCIPNSFVNSNSYSTISHLWTIQNGATIITSTDQNPTVNFSVPGSYDVTLAVTTSFGTVTDTKSDFIYVGNAPAVPCQPNSLNNGNFWQTVYNVSLNTLNNTSDSYENDGYSDYRCSSSTLLTSGQTYNLSLSLRAYSLDELVEVYIDYNNDNTLSPSEMIYSGSVASAPTGNTGVLTSNILIPNDAVTGTPLLMRVIGESLSISDGKRSCTSSFSIGDVEDYTVVIQSTCSNSSANVGLDAVICQGSAFTTSAAASNGSILWSSSGDGLFNDATLENPEYTPGAGDILNGSVILTMDVTNLGGCSDASDNITLSILDFPTADAGLDQSICESSTFTASASSTNGTVLWSTSGDGLFSDATMEDPVYTPGSGDITLGNVTLTMTVSNGSCVDASDDLLLTISPSSVANAGLDASICSSGVFSTSGSASNGSILWTSSGDGNFSDPTILNSLYTPGLSDIGNGTTTLTLTVTNPGVCSNASDDVDLTITGIPTADAGIDQTICETSSIVAQATSSNGTIVWTSSGSGTFTDPSVEDVEYTPSSSDINSGSVTLTMTVSSGGCSDAVDDFIINIDNESVADAGIDASICSLASFTSESTLLNGAILWTSSGDGSFSDATLEDMTYTPGSNDILSGGVILSVNVTNPGVCSNESDDLFLTITGTPTSDAGIDQSICESNVFNASATASNGSIIWSSNGTGSFDDNSIEDVVYTPSLNDIMNGSVVLTMNVSSNGCIDAIDNVNVIISNLSTVDAGIDESICSSVSSYLTDASVSNGSILWVSSGTGVFTDPTIEDAIYTPSINDLNSGSVTLTLGVTNPGVCPNVSDDLVLTFGSNSTADVGSDETICSSSNYSINANGSEGLYLWSTSGTGSFDDNSIEDPTYTPSSSDVNTGFVTLTLDVVNQNGCLSATDDLILTIDELPTISFNTLMNESFCLENTIEIESIVSSGDISWSSSGDGFIIDPSLESIVYSPGISDIASGQVDFSLNVSNGIVCPLVSDQITVLIVEGPDAPVVNLIDTCGYSKLEILNNGNYTWSTGQTGSSITVNQNGTYTVYETVGGCISPISSLVASPLSEPLVSIDPFNSVCESDTKFLLSGGLPVGGEYSFNGNVVASFNPSFAGIGSHIITYSYENGNGCLSSASTTIEVGCADLKENDELNSILLYPNPANNIINIKSDKLMLEISISDNSGRIVDLFNPAGKDVLRDISKLQNGMYYIDIKYEIGHKKLKFIILH